MTHKMGPKGQLVVPRDVRDRHGFKPGDHFVFDDSDGDVRIRRAESTDLPSLRGLLRDADDPVPLTAALEADRRWERAHDALREAEYALRDAERRSR
jgi:AbrB family looped-hinge helix DNA binding protein